MAGTSKSPYQRERKRVGEKIRSIRKQKKLSQEALAVKAKMDMSYLGKIENGVINTSIRYLIKIARGLGVKVRDLFDF